MPSLIARLLRTLEHGGHQSHRVRGRRDGDGVMVMVCFCVAVRGWSVDIRDGQYRAIWPGWSMARSPLGNEGWSGREGQPPGSSVTKERLTPAEGSVLPRSPGTNRYGVTGGAFEWFRLVFEHANFSTIREPSASVSLRDTQTG